jgi:hypothetical protein
LLRFYVIVLQLELERKAKEAKEREQKLVAEALEAEKRRVRIPHWLCTHFF